MVDVLEIKVKKSLPPELANEFSATLYSSFDLSAYCFIVTLLDKNNAHSCENVTIIGDVYRRPL